MRSFKLRLSPRAALIGLALACVTTAPQAWAAPVEPPLHLLHSGKNRLIAGTIKEINPPNRLVFVRGKVIGEHADVPELIDVIVDPGTVQSVALGERYLFAYSSLHSDKRMPGKIALNKSGAVLVSSTGVEPALFRDSPTLRSLLAASDTEEERDSPRLLRRLLKLLHGKDIQLQYLAAAQIGLDADLGALLSDRDRAVLRSVVSDAGGTTNTRYTLLHAAFLFPGLYGEWALPVAQEVLATTPLDGYSQGPRNPTGLVLLAFDIVQKPDAELPRESIARWLRSPYRLFREQSTRLLEARFPGEQREVVVQALRDPKLNEETRQYLDDQLRRIQRH
jgi:hypothetical protein